MWGSLEGLALLGLPDIAEYYRTQPRRDRTPNWAIRLVAPLIAAIRGH